MYENKLMFKDGTIIISDGMVYVVVDGELLPPVPVTVIKDFLIQTIEIMAKTRDKRGE